MRKNFHLLLLASLLIAFSSCITENIDELIEEELPFEPTEINTDNGIIEYRFQDGTELLTEGSAKKSNNGTYYIFSTSATVNCSDNSSSISYSRQRPGDLFTITFNPDTNAIFYDLPRANIDAVINGDSMSVFNASNFFLECSDFKLVIEIQEETEDFIKGTFTDEFFTFDLPFVEPFRDCSNFRSVGILTASFAVPLEKCQTDNNVEYRSEDNSKAFSNGVGLKLTQNDTTRYFVIANSETCDKISQVALGDVVYSSEDAYTIDFLRLPDGTLAPQIATLGTGFIEGEDNFFISSSLLPCNESSSPTVEITNETDEFVEGIYTSDFWDIKEYIENPDCSAWERPRKVIEVHFSVPIKTCD